MLTTRPLILAEVVLVAASALVGVFTVVVVVVVGVNKGSKAH